MSTDSDIKETPKMDLEISGICYMHTMLNIISKIIMSMYEI